MKSLNRNEITFSLVTLDLLNQNVVNGSIVGKGQVSNNRYGTLSRTTMVPLMTATERTSPSSYREWTTICEGKSLSVSCAPYLVLRTHGVALRTHGVALRTHGVAAFPSSQQNH